MKIARIFKVICVFVFLLVGGIFGFGVPGIIHGLHGKCTVETTAVIVDYVTEDGSSDMYSPVYSFTMEDGTQVEKHTSTYTNIMPEIGKEVTLMVNPDDPTKFYDPAVEKVFVKIFRIIGIVFLVIGVIILLIPIGKIFSF